MGMDFPDLWCALEAITSMIKENVNTKELKSEVEIIKAHIQCFQNTINVLPSLVTSIEECKKETEKHQKCPPTWNFIFQGTLVSPIPDDLPARMKIVENLIKNLEK